MEKIYAQIEALFKNNSDYNKGVQDALNILKKDIEPVITEAVENAIWHHTHQN